MERVLTSVYRDWHVVIHCMQANAGFFRSVAFVREPGQGATELESCHVDSSTLLESPGNFYPNALLANAAALASARRFIEAAGSHAHLQ